MSAGPAAPGARFCTGRIWLFILWSSSRSLCCVTGLLIATITIWISRRIRNSVCLQTRKLLKGLDRPVSIYVFERESGFRERRDLMNLYSSASHFVHVQYVDPNRTPGRANEFGVQN